MNNLLTGKAKKDFEKWYSSTNSVDIYKSDYSEQVFNTVRNALIIEWFDSVGYTIDRNSYDKNMIIIDWTNGLEDRTVIDCDYLNPFTEWYEEAITKANNLYNNSN